MTKPLYSTAARRDLIDILQFISRDKPDAAVSWVEKIEAEMGEFRPLLGSDVRWNFIGRYVTFHRKHGDTVEILRVIPGDRNITKL